MLIRRVSLSLMIKLEIRGKSIILTMTLRPSSLSLRLFFRMPSCSDPNLCFFYSLVLYHGLSKGSDIYKVLRSFNKSWFVT